MCEKYPVVGQLQGQLHEGVGAYFHFLNKTLAKLSERKYVAVDIISQCLCNSERFRNLSLNL